MSICKREGCKYKSPRSKGYCSVTCANLDALPKDTLVWLRFETRNFTFDAFGKTKAEAWTALRKGWAEHVKNTNADPGYLNEFKEDVQEIHVSPGVCVRDLDRDLNGVIENCRP